MMLPPSPRGKRMPCGAHVAIESGPPRAITRARTEAHDSRRHRKFVVGPSLRKFLLPGAQKLDWIMTRLLGIAG